VRQSGGACITVTDQEILEAVREMSSLEGILPAPEGAACLPAWRKLVAQGLLTPEQTAVLFNTGSGLKYLDVISRPAPASKGTEENIGGLITPF
jgi:threonine synthase